MDNLLECCFKAALRCLTFVSFRYISEQYYRTELEPTSVVWVLVDFEKQQWFKNLRKLWGKVGLKHRWLRADKSVASLAWGRSWAVTERERKESGGRMVWWAVWTKRQRKEKEKWEKEGEKANLASGENGLMGWREEGGGRGQPYQPHVQQPRPPGEDCKSTCFLSNLIHIRNPSPFCSHTHLHSAMEGEKTNDAISYIWMDGILHPTRRSIL